MSRTIDEKVVEMRFDNKQFESNVATSMSTLEKLKRSLKLDGASKGLEDIDKASKKVDMSGLGGAVESVKVKFSALDVVAVTALANITNSAVNAGKQLIKSLSVDQITKGFEKFSDKTTSVATLVAQGNAIEDVNDQLDRLNWFTDETSYNFTEMVSNIAKFTATGKGLNESVTAMEGIATWAALSGQNAATASRAMYQLSQAMGAGTMRLEDFRSIQNASMDTEEFRKKCIEAAISLETLQDNGDGTYTSLVEGASGASWSIEQFASNLTSELWLTSDVMMKVFNEYSSAVEGIYDAADERGMLASEIIDEIHDKANELKTGTEATSEDIDAAIRALGYTLEDGSLQFDSFGLKAFEAAQKARTFQDAIDSVKDAVSTGWMNTFELIFGNANEATVFWTDIANMLWDMFAAGGETRNQFLEFALNFSKPWEAIEAKLNGSIFGKIKDVSQSFENVTDKVQTAAEKLQYFQDVVNRVWNGDFNNAGDNPDRYDLLTKAGYNWQVVQDLVNKGYQYKLTIEDVEASHKKFGLTMGLVTDETKDATKATEEAAIAFEDLTDEQLVQAGLTEEEIDLYRALEKEAKRLGISVSDLAEEMSTNDGRTLLLESFKNALQSIMDIGTVIKSAWKDIFNPPGIGEMAVKLYGIIKSLNEFSQKLILVDADTGELNETGQKLQRTFKGIFAILDIVRTVIGGGLRIAFNILTKVLSAFNLDILDVTASIGDALVAFRDWILEGNILAKSFDWLISKIPVVVNIFKEWFNVFKQTPAVQKLIDAINAIGDSFRKLTSGEIDINEFARSLGENVAKVLKSLPGIAIQIGRDFIEGFKNGISDSISGAIKSVIRFCLNFVKGFAEALGVQSPSWKAFDIAVDFFRGLINGAKSMLGPVIDVLKKIGEVIVKVFKSFWDFITDESGNIEWGKLFAGGSIVGLLLILKKFADVFSGVSDVLEGVEYLLHSTGKAVKSFSKVLNGVAWDLRAQAVQKMAIAVAILVASIWLLTKIDDPTKLRDAAITVGILVGVLVLLSVAMSKLSSVSVVVNKESKKLDANGLVNPILQIGLALLAVAAVIKIIGDMSPEKAAQGFKGLAAITVGMLAFLSIMGLVSRYAKNVTGIGGMMVKLSLAMILMVGVCKIIGSLSGDEMLKGAAFATGFAIFVIAITKVAKSAGNNVGKVGGMIIKVTIAMALMVGVCKLVSLLSVEEMLKGAAFAAAFTIFVAALVRSAKIGKKQQLAKIGGMVLSISASLALMVGVCKLVGMLSVDEMIKGAYFVAGFVLLLKALISILTIGNEQKIAKVTGTIFAMSAAIGILAAVSILLGFVDLPSLAKGVAAVTILSAMMALMVRGLKGAQNVKGSIIAMTVAIGLMAASVAILSFIDTKSLIAAAGSMSIMMAAFSLMVKSLKGLGKEKIPILPIVVLTGVIMVLAGVIYGLKDVDPKSAIASALSLAGLMLVMTGVLKILSNIGAKAGGAIVGAIALAALGLVLREFVWVLSSMEGLKNAGSITITLSILVGLMFVMIGVLAILSKIGTKAIKALAGVVALAALGLVLREFVWVLSSIEGLTNAGSITITLSILAGLILSMVGILAILSTIGTKAFKALAGVVALAALGLVLREFVWVLSSMEGLKNARDNVITLSILAAVCTGLVALLSLIGLSAFKALAGVVALAALGLVLREFVWVLESMDGLKNARANAITLSILAVICTGLVALLSLIGVSALKALVGVVALAALGLVLREFAWVLASMDGLKNAESNAVALSILAGVCTVLIALLTIIGVSAFGALAGVVALAALGLVLREFVWVLAAMDGLKNARKNVISLSILATVCTVLIGLLSLISVAAFGALAGVVTLAALGLVLREFVWVLASMDGLKNARDNAITLSILATVCTVLIGLLSLISVAAFGALAGVLALAALGFVLREFVWVLASMDGLKNARENAITLSILAGACTVIVTLLSLIGPLAFGALSGVIALAALGLVLREFVWVLASMEELSNAKENAIELSILAGACTVMIALLALIAPLAIGALAGVVALAALGLVLREFVWVLASMEELTDAKENATVLALLMSTLADVLVKISLLGPLAFIGEAAIMGLIGVIGVIGTLAVAIGALMNNGIVDIQKFLDTGLPLLERLAGSIGKMIGNFIGGIGEGISDSLVKMGENISKFMAKLKKASDSASGIKGESFDGVKKLIETLVTIGKANVRTTIGDIFSMFTNDKSTMASFQEDAVAFFEAMKEIGKAASEVELNKETVDYVLEFATTLANVQSSTVTNDLSSFGRNIAGFITWMARIFEYMDDVKVSPISAVKLDIIISIASKLAELQSSLNSIGGMVTWFTGRDDLGTFGENVSAFIKSMETAVDDINDVDIEEGTEDKLGFVIDVAQKLATLQSSLNAIGGMVTWFSGRDDLGTFGDNVADFVMSMRTAIRKINFIDIKDDTEAKLGFVIDAAQRLADLQSTLEPMGGVVKWFTGQTDLGTFGENVGKFAEAMGKLNEGLGEKGITADAVTSITNSGNAILELQKALPKEGLFDGKMNLSEFSDYVSDFGDAMDNFVSVAKDANPENMDAVISTAKKIRDLISSLATVDTSGLSTFVTLGVTQIAFAMIAYSEAVEDIDIEAVSVSVEAAMQLKALINSLSKMDTSGISNFNVVSIGSTMKDYSDSVSEVNLSAVSSSIDCANRLKNFIFSLADWDNSGIYKFKVESIGSALKAYSDSITGIEFSSIITSIDSAHRLAIFISGLTSLNTSGVSSFTEAINELSSANIEGFAKAFSAFYNAGSYLVTGFCNGISDNSYKAAAKAKAMAEAAVEAAREALKINSPSKVFKAIGSGIPEGFAMGIGMLGGEVEKSVTGMASSAINTTRSAMANVLDALNNDMDTQPRIRPVVDLSNVQTGVNAINGMFDRVQTVGISSSFNAINASMNRKLQNGTNDDVVSAINKLGLGLENNRGDTYNFGNFTYDGGTEVADAVGTLIRYARIGRRV